MTSLMSSDSVVVLPQNYGALLTRPHKYRNSRTGAARSTRTQIDHDVFEGLPVRHWRKRPINVNTAPEKENTHDVKSRNLAWPELEMPRDAHLLSEMSQNLLRAARMPQAKKTAIAPLLEDDKEPGEEEDADREIDLGFVAKRWAVMPKDIEGLEPEYLAKRRKGLPSVHGGAIAAIGGIQQMRKTKIRKIDTSGNSSVLEVLVPDGQTVEGEIFEDEASPTQAPAPGTVVEGVGVVNAEGLVIAGDQGLPANNRRRPPPPKRKAKGPGRGRKKKVAFAGSDGKPTSIEVNGVPISAIGNEDGHPLEGAHNATGHDMEVGDDSMLQDGDQEGDDGSEEGSEGDEGEENDREEGELSPSASPPRSSPKDPPPVSTVSQPDLQDPLSSDLEARSATPNPAQASGFMSDPFAEPRTEPMVEAMDDAPDEILDQSTSEMLDIPARAMAEESADRHDPESMHVPADTPMALSTLDDDLGERGTGKPDEGKPTDSAHESTSGLPEEPMAVQGRSPQVSDGAPNATAVPQASELPRVANPSIALLDPVAQPVAQPVTDSLIPSIADPPAESVTEPPMDIIAETDTQIISEPSMEVNSEQQADLTSGQPMDIVPDSSINVISEFEAGPTTESTAVLAQDPPTETVSEAPAKTTPDSIPQALEEAAVESIIDSVKDAAPPPNMESLPVTPTQTSEAFMYTSTAEATAESRSEPLLLRATEPIVESATETTERKFSFTRPTASPKAPTPSPPTPIQDKFGLRAPYYSPKAPTMSPPTPIDRSMPSSPEMPLSEQQFQLPPQIDDVREVDLAPAPDMQDIPDADRISVEATSQGGPQLNAQIPVDHNPLDGMAAPKLVYGHDVEIGERDDEAPGQFSDGEEDLLGGLERSLDRR